MAKDNHQKSSASNLHRCRNLTVLLIILSGDAYAATTFLSCPSNFTDGQNASAVCVVDIAEVRRVCFVTTTTVTYNLKSSTGLNIDSCSSNYPACSPPASGVQCGCESPNATHYTYTYTFNANKTLLLHANLTCQLDCTKAQLPVTETNGYCGSFTFDQTSTPFYQSSTPISSLSPSNVTDYLSSTASPSNVTENPGGTRDPCPKECIIIIVVVVVVVSVAAVVVIVIIVVIKKKKNNKRNLDSERTQEGESIHLPQPDKQRDKRGES